MDEGEEDAVATAAVAMAAMLLLLLFVTEAAGEEMLLKRKPRLQQEQKGQPQKANKSTLVRFFFQRETKNTKREWKNKKILLLWSQYLERVRSLSAAAEGEEPPRVLV